MEASRELRKKDKLERELNEAKAQVEQKSIELKNLQQNLEKAKGELQKYELQIKDQKTLLDKTIKENDVLNNRCSKLQKDFESQVMNINSLANENALKSQDLRVTKYLLII